MGNAACPTLLRCACSAVGKPLRNRSEASACCDRFARNPCQAPRAQTKKENAAHFFKRCVFFFMHAGCIERAGLSQSVGAFPGTDRRGCFDDGVRFLRQLAADWVAARRVHQAYAVHALQRERSEGAEPSADEGGGAGYSVGGRCTVAHTSRLPIWNTRTAQIQARPVV